MTTFGAPRHHLRVTDSTNDRARALIELGAPSGTVVTAAEQTAGRGRHGRTWAAPAGAALLYSAILRPLTAAHALLPLAVPLAVCEAIEALAPVDCQIKWPNDVWIERRKVSGVLIEARPPDWAVIGAGINVSVSDDEFPEDLRWPATSVGHGVVTKNMCDALDRSLGEWVDAEPQRVHDAYRERDALRGLQISWDDGPAGGSGTAAGIDARGNLLVELGGGDRTTLGAGEVSLRLA